MYGSWGHAYNQLKRWSEDAYNSSFGKYLPSRSNSSYYGAYFGSGINRLIDWGGQQFNRKWENAHGSERFWLSQVPFWGWGKQLADKAKFYEDYYRNTGQDPRYSQTYGGSPGGLAGQVASQVGSLSPARWARDLESLFKPQFEENLTREQAFSKGYW